MTQATLIYPHQLFKHHPSLQNAKIVYLIEDPLFFSQYNFHRQKLMLHRASMKRYVEELKPKKPKIRYVEASELKRSGDIVSILKSDRVDAIRFVDPEDDYLRKQLTNACTRATIACTIDPDPNFLTPVDVLEDFIGAKKKLFFTQFYIEQRKRLDCLIDDEQKPIGGKWSFDTENRKKLPKNQAIPDLEFPTVDRFAKEARQYVNRSFPKAIGEDRDLLYPSSRTDSLRWLNKFLEERATLFGDYEDAIVKSESFLFHSCLTPMLNIGLISPQQIIDAVIVRLESMPINSLEGFVRQVIGWREFIRAVYRQRGVLQRTTNYWKHSKPIPRAFYDGSTGIEPVDIVIHRILKTGYCHHIERLMVLGNFMLLCRIDPDNVYQWFMELFIDAYDWVMVPNVYGMSQHADGGLMTTKPYISGSSYILKMSDFKRGPWCDIWDGLYWSFMSDHRSFFERNPRMSVMTKQLDRMGNKLEVHRKNAASFLKRLDRV